MLGTICHQIHNNNNNNNNNTNDNNKQCIFNRLTEITKAVCLVLCIKGSKQLHKIIIYIIAFVRTFLVFLKTSDFFVHPERESFIVIQNSLIDFKKILWKFSIKHINKLLNYCIIITYIKFFESSKPSFFFFVCAITFKIIAFFGTLSSFRYINHVSC